MGAAGWYMSGPTVLPLAADTGAGELGAVNVLLAHQKTNLLLYSFAAGFLFLLGIALFAFLTVHGAIKEIGAALGNFLTFISGLLPTSGVISSNNRIGELEAAKVLIAKVSMSSNEQELLRELLKK